MLGKTAYEISDFKSLGPSSSKTKKLFRKAQPRALVHVALDIRNNLYGTFLQTGWGTRNERATSYLNIDLCFDIPGGAPRPASPAVPIETGDPSSCHTQCPCGIEIAESHRAMNLVTMGRTHTYHT